MGAAQQGGNALKLRRSLSDKNADVAGALTRLADRRMDLAQARNRLLSEVRLPNGAQSVQNQQPFENE